MKKTQLIIILIILLSFAVGSYFYPRMPEMMASHWNARGDVDGYMTKCWALFFMPFLSIVMLLFFLLLPKIDPLKENIEKFRKYYNLFILLTILFLFYIYLLSIFWNLGYKFSMGQLMMPAIGALLFYCGVLLENAKRNWFIGFRTPWTLSSDLVWEKTNKMGGKVFKVAGIITALAFLFSSLLLYLIVIPILFISILFLVLYSYFEYQKELTKKN